MTDHPKLDEFVSAASKKGFPREELERWAKMIKSGGVKEVKKDPRWAKFFGDDELMGALKVARIEQTMEEDDPATGLNQLFSQINAQ